MLRSLSVSILFVVLLQSGTVAAQILSDSLVQTVGYWDRGEQQLYRVSIDKYRVTGSDTSGREKMQYLASVTVIDSAADGYTLEWHLHDHVVTARNPAVVKLLTLTNGLRIRFRTNELGVFRELMNTDAIREQMLSALPLIRKEYKTQKNLEALIAPVASSLQNKEATEAMLSRDIRQFLMFHGAQYRLGKEITSAILLPNNYGGKPFDGEVTVILDAINKDGDNYVLRSVETVDRKQLLEATFGFLSAAAMQSGAVAPRREDLAGLKMEVETGARLHNSGWVLYSFQVKTVSSGSVVSVEEMVLEI
ncbi:MAG: hypothetical protein ACKORJ_05730, partial [Bacteroidota bacterium]